jgi:predicted amidophosphoribosyltransferase
MKPEFLNYVRPRTLAPLYLSGVPTFAPLRYEHKSREWIKTLKFQMTISKSHYHYLELLAQYIAKQIEEPCRAIVPIPSHPIRSLCQVDLSWEWSRLLGKALGIPIWHNVLLGPPLYEALWHKPQKDLKPQERIERSLQLDRFRIHPQKAHMAWDRILLVDDVLNTGSTFREALQVLRNSGYRVQNACFLALTPQAEVLSC